MQKYDKMIEYAKKVSEEKTEAAMTALESMYRNNIKISIAELVNLTGLSRGFFYNNSKVNSKLVELKEKQNGKMLRKSHNSSISKAQEIRIKNLEQRLSNSVPKDEYEALQKKYKELQEKYNKIENEELLKVYDEF